MITYTNTAFHCIRVIIFTEPLLSGGGRYFRGSKRKYKMNVSFGEPLFSGGGGRYYRNSTVYITIIP